MFGQSKIASFRTLAFAGALVLAATGAAMAQTIQFGAVLPLTGPAAVIGTEEQHGIEFALTLANAKGGVRGHKIELLSQDNQAKPDQSILSFNKLVDLNHVAVVFTGFSGPTLAMAPLATRKKVLLVNGGAQADKLETASPYLINTLPVLGGEIRVLTRYIAQDLGKKTAAILFENDAAGIAGRDDLVKSYPAAGGKIIAQEPVQFGDTNYRPALLKLAAAKPEVLFVMITSGLTQLADQIKQIDAKFLVVGNTFFADPATISNPNAEGFTHTQVALAAPPELSAAFKKQFGTDFGFFAQQYYAATNIVLECADRLLKEGKPITGTNLREALFAIKTFDGLSKTVFTTNTATAQFNVNRMQGGKDVTIHVLKPE